MLPESFSFLAVNMCMHGRKARAKHFASESQLDGYGQTPEDELKPSPMFEIKRRF